MKASIDLHLIINGVRNVKRGEFQVRWNEEVSVVAYNWIRQIRKETGYHAAIEKVIIDGDRDITNCVKEIDERPIPDIDLPF
jgi:hypothetical protein